jgi:hypothetical protein
MAGDGARSVFSYLKTVASDTSRSAALAPSPSKLRSRSPRLADSPSPTKPPVARQAPQLDIKPGDDEEVRQAKLESYNIATRAFWGITSAHETAGMTHDRDQSHRPTKQALIEATHTGSPGKLGHEWVQKLVFLVKKRRTTLLMPIVMQYVDDHVRPKCRDPRMLREFENLALAMDHMLEFRDLLRNPAPGRSLDVLVQRFKSIEYVITQTNKLGSSLRHKTKKKLWLTAMGFELVPVVRGSWGVAEATAVRKGYIEETKAFGGFELSDSDTSGADTDSSADSPAAKDIKKPTGAQKKKKRRKAAARKRAAA